MTDFAPDNMAGWVRWVNKNITILNRRGKSAGGGGGTPGPPGPAGTVTVGSTTTGAPGTSASVSNSGTPSAAVFSFTIPRGDVGATGTAATVAVGTVTTGTPGSSASVTNAGTSGAAVFNFTIPRGDVGATGTAATVAVGSVATGLAGTSVSVTNSGTSSAAVFDFVIPRGDTGAAGAGAVPSGSIVAFGGVSAPSGFLLCDGSSVSRTTYSTLFSILTSSQGTFTVSIATPAAITKTAHGLTVGAAFYVTTTGALPTGMAANTTYYVIGVPTANTLNFSATRGGAPVNTTGTQSGVHTLVLAPYGIASSTTFNLPDLRGRAPMGMLGSDALFDALGELGGTTSHSHALSNLGVAKITTVAGGEAALIDRITVPTGGTWTPNFRAGTSTAGANATTASAGSGTGLMGSTDSAATLPPYITLNFIIKT